MKGSSEKPEPSQPVGRTRHGELSLDAIAEIQPGLGVLMPQIAERFTLVFYAAKGGNWDLSHYELRQMEHLFRVATKTRPKQTQRIEKFLAEQVTPLKDAIKSRDWNTFESLFRRVTDAANENHRELGVGFIVYKLPPEPASHLDFAPQEKPRKE